MQIATLQPKQQTSKTGIQGSASHVFQCHLRHFFHVMFSNAIYVRLRLRGVLPESPLRLGLAFQECLHLSLHLNRPEHHALSLYKRSTGIRNSKRCEGAFHLALSYRSLHRMNLT